MSPLSPRRLVVALHADRAVWALHAGWLRGELGARGTEAVAEPGTAGVLAALAKSIAAANARGAGLAVLLSGEFARMLLVPWPAAVTENDEGEALARHYFKRVFGGDAESWAICFDAASDAGQRLACAIERPLLEGVLAAAKTSGMKLVSVQPLFGAVFNLWHGEFGGERSLFVAAEPGRWYSAEVERGEWAAVRYGRLEANTPEALAAVIERERALAGGDGVGVRLFAPEIGAPAAVPGLKRLAAAPRKGFAQERDAPYATLLGGLA